jgi:hypothetical protein
VDAASSNASISTISINGQNTTFANVSLTGSAQPISVNLLSNDFSCPLLPQTYTVSAQQGKEFKMVLMIIHF